MRSLVARPRAVRARRGQLLLGLVTLLLSTLASAETKRLAVVVGNNAGTGDMPPLRYAESDAGKMARVLVELGDVDADDVMLLQGQGVSAVERAIVEAKERVALWRRSPDNRTVVFFYFSGHSDGEAIELGREKLAYARLKAMLSGTGGDVRLVVIDACRSGAGLREKGGKPAASFTIRLADTLQASGEAFITSSAADESALESSEVMGSYFTHNFISGLRGAADSSGDKLVTLAEAYQYAYDRTVVSTAMLPVGAQHPNYDFKLSGQGELVLSSLLKPSSLLVLPDADRSLVLDVVRDQVVVEVVGGAREVALAPGTYGLRLFRGGKAFGGRITLAQGTRHVVALDTLHEVSSAALVARKGGGGPTITREPKAPRPARAVGLGFSLGATGRIVVPADTWQSYKWQLRVDVEPVTTTFVAFTGGRLAGTFSVLGLGELSLDPAPNGVDPGNEGGAQLRLGYRLALELWRLQLSVGFEVGPGLLSQLYGTRASTLSVNLAPRAVLRVHLADALWLLASGDLTVTGLNYGETAQAASFRWYAWPTMALGFMVSL